MSLSAKMPKKEKPWTYALKMRGDELVMCFEAGHTSVIYTHQALVRICAMCDSERLFIPVPCHVLSEALLEFNAHNERELAA